MALLKSHQTLKIQKVILRSFSFTVIHNEVLQEADDIVENYTLKISICSYLQTQINLHA